MQLPSQYSKEKLYEHTKKEFFAKSQTKETTKSNKDRSIRNNSTKSDL
jgi:hypothetical protein